MKLSFRQGIARYQTDIYGSPSFLQKSSQTGEFIDLIASPAPTIIVFAHRSATYIVGETKTVAHAWGPFTQGGNRYLYWDINLLDAALTRGSTAYPPVVQAAPPVTPPNDQHWFDTGEKVMKVWNGSKWVEKIRVFAATYSSQAIIQPASIGTQAGQIGEFEAGNLVLDTFGKPLRQADGTFVTSASELSIINTTRSMQLEAEMISGMADEFIPKFSFVQIRPNRRLLLARSPDWRSRVIGLVTEDLYESEVGTVITSGLVRYEQWNWALESAGKSFFCGATGEISLSPPRTGVVQNLGHIFDRDSIYLNIQPVTILTDLTHEVFAEPTGPSGLAPEAQFTATPITGTAPLTVNFRSTSLHSPTSFEWDFKNDGAVDTRVEHPSWTFGPGSHSVRLRVFNEFGADDEVKLALITVSAPVAVGSKTNLEIQLSGPLQVERGQFFSVTVTTSNSGYLTATRVQRTISAADVGNTVVGMGGLPSGSITSRIDKTTVIALPLISSLASGQSVAGSFTITAPNQSGTIRLQAVVASPETDSTLGDNSTELSIKVK